VARPRKVDIGIATSQRLYAAAEKEFGLHGQRARLEDIAQRAGITRASLLYHFATKDALYRAVIHGSFARLGVALAAAMGRGENVEERLDAVVREFLEFLRDNPSLPPLLLREVLDGQGPGHQLLLEEVAPVLGQVERFVHAAGRGRVRRGLPLRAALMQIVSSALLRASAGGDLARSLWGPKDSTRALARMLVFEP
jgi:AcrR family transcriptional regulator